MNSCRLSLPNRQVKPRQYGLTILIDNGVPLNFFKDTIDSADEFIDFVKFGWGTSVITKHLEEKITYLKEKEINFFFGGTLFEKFLSQGRIDDFYNYCKKYNCKYIEISNGTVDLANNEKAKFISDFSDEFYVFSEVGSKDSDKSVNSNSSQWVQFIQEDLAAGAKKVITEARESGTSGICKSNGELRFELIDEFITSGIDLSQLVFEAPNKKMQTYFIKLFGQDVNLANIPFQETIALETLRLGLRSDTLHLFDN